jgi:hypothetical protein
MKLRPRFFAALFALIGLLTVSVSGAWAATCATTMETGSAAPAAGAVAPAMPCSGAASLHAQGTELPDGHESGTSPCPSMPMSATGACGAVLALPADPSPRLAPSLSEAQLSPDTDSVRELLLAGAFFRPPIA